ncbi:hypothetical protein B0H11DRAFT_2103668 [Mycena galericulata]|nr:hypothetical protein B0H11DRAFT_2103668 [Mycena galericulata]
MDFIGSSPFAHLLSSGLPPSNEDTLFIGRLVDDANALALSLDDEIAVMETSLARLRAERVDVTSFAIAHEAMLSPHQYYPADILCLIFRWTVELTGNPWLLGLICRRWRRIALDFPPIWSSISVGPDPIPPSYASRKLYPRDMIEAHVARSSGLPLTITFHDPRATGEERLFEDLQGIVDVLAPTSQRWEKVHLKTFRPEHFSLFDSLKGRLSSLKELTLEGIVNPNPPLDAFAIAPKLTKLNFVRYMFHLPAALRVPWHQITDYTADLDYNHEHLATLSLLTNVDEARLTLENLAPTEHEPIRRIPTLRRLYVNRGCILDLDLPQLAELTFEPLDREPGLQEVPLENLLTFLMLSSPPLTKLCLIGPEFSDELLVSILQQTPALIDLCIQCRHKHFEMVYFTDVVDFLHVAVGQDVHLPSMQTLTFGGYSFTDYDRLADMVESRWRFAPCPLTSFGLITRHSPDMAHAREKLDVLGAEGLNLTLVDGEGATDALLSLPFFEIAYSLDHSWSMWQWTPRPSNP